MTTPGTPVAKFTISAAGKEEIENLRRFWDEQRSDPAAVVVIAWGLFEAHTGEHWESILVTFYGESEFDEVAHGIQEVSGLPIVFFTTEEYALKFDGKVVDHDPDRGFFLRPP